MDWYSFLSQIGSWFAQPLTDIYYGMGEQFPLIGALLLGIIGAFAPCQLSGNVAALTVFGKDLVGKEAINRDLGLFILGKVVLYSALGGIVFVFGQQLSQEAIPVFQWARKLLAPMFLLIGLYMMGWIRLSMIKTESLTQKLEQFSHRFTGGTKAFLLGFTFSLGFCPTMFWLFFGLGMPLMLSSSIGPVLPTVFAIGTAIPLVLVLLLISLTGNRKNIMKQSRKWGFLSQKISGAIFILLAISDYFTFW